MTKVTKKEIRLSNEAGELFRKWYDNDYSPADMMNILTEIEHRIIIERVKQSFGLVYVWDNHKEDNKNEDRGYS